MLYGTSTTKVIGTRMQEKNQSVPIQKTKSAVKVALGSQSFHQSKAYVRIPNAPQNYYFLHLHMMTGVWP